MHKLRVVNKIWFLNKIYIDSPISLFWWFNIPKTYYYFFFWLCFKKYGTHNFVAETWFWWQLRGFHPSWKNRCSSLQNACSWPSNRCSPLQCALSDLFPTGGFLSWKHGQMLSIDPCKTHQSWCFWAVGTVFWPLRCPFCQSRGPAPRPFRGHKHGLTSVCPFFCAQHNSSAHQLGPIGNGSFLGWSGTNFPGGSVRPGPFYSRPARSPLCPVYHSFLTTCLLSGAWHGDQPPCYGNCW